MLSSKISAADEEDVLEELAALQAEQVQVRPPFGASKAHGIQHVPANTRAFFEQTKMPHAPLHALPERQQSSIEAEPEQEPESDVQRTKERRQAVLA